MANLIPFNELEVGKEYRIQSRYWHQMLEGIFRVTERDIQSGTGWVERVDDKKDAFKVEADWDWFWDDIPTERQILKQATNWTPYEPPKKEGAYYYGSFMEYEEVAKLDELLDNLKKTFKDKLKFHGEKKQFGYSCYAVLSTDLDFPIDDLLCDN